jgi:hypothetical protein
VQLVEEIHVSHNELHGKQFFVIDS